MVGKPGKSVCACVKQQAAMTQDKGSSATITERLKKQIPKRQHKAGGSALLIKSTEFQVYHLESTQARQRFFTLPHVRKKKTCGVLLNAMATFHRRLAEVRLVTNSWPRCNLFFFFSI